MGDKRLEKRTWIEWFAAGCTQPKDFAIGAEHEKFLFDVDSHAPIPYKENAGRDIQTLLQELCKEDGWQAVFEGENIIGIKHEDGKAITLEPSGQLELSGALKKDLHGVCRETNEHLRTVVEAGDQLGIGFLGIGFAPVWRLEQMPIMPKKRYDIMRQYMPKVGTKGLLMMHQTCTVQVNLDYASLEDMARKMRVGMALQGMVGALFANSPFAGGKVTNLQSNRLAIWQDVDRQRCGLVESVFRHNFDFEAWVDYLLDVPMYFLKRAGETIDVTGESFASLQEGTLQGFEGDFATIEDWQEHVSVAFPDVRLKRYIEMRGTDAGSSLGLCCMPAIWVGLLYDEGVLQDAANFVQDWSFEEVDALAKRVPLEGMRAQFRGRSIREWLADILDLAATGLQRRNIKDKDDRDERQYLDSAFALLEGGVSLSDVLKEKLKSEWGNDIERLYEDLRYR